MHRFRKISESKFTQLSRSQHRVQWLFFHGDVGFPNPQNAPRTCREQFRCPTSRPRSLQACSGNIRNGFALKNKGVREKKNLKDFTLPWRKGTGGWWGVGRRHRLRGFGTSVWRRDSAAATPVAATPTEVVSPPPPSQPTPRRYHTLLTATWAWLRPPLRFAPSMHLPWLRGPRRIPFWEINLE